MLCVLQLHVNNTLVQPCYDGRPAMTSLPGRFCRSIIVKGLEALMCEWVVAAGK